MCIRDRNKCLENTSEIIRNNLNKIEQSKNNTNEDCNGNVVLGNELTNQNSIENSDLIKNVVSESTDEIAECSDNEMLMYAYELERERKNSIVVE